MSNPLLQGKGDECHLLLGNEAIVRGALEAGVHVVTCYPGTPSSEVPDTFRRIGGNGDCYILQYSVNEKVAMEVACGAALAGAKALVTMKHVGLNVAADPLFTATYTGLPGGLVVLSADDPGFQRAVSLFCQKRHHKAVVKRHGGPDEKADEVGNSREWRILSFVSFTILILLCYAVIIYIMQLRRQDSILWAIIALYDSTLLDKSIRALVQLKRT